MILDICANSNVLKAIRFAKIVIDIIKIIVPIILILSLSIEYLMAIKKDDPDLLAKANKNVIRKTIAAILVFLIPTVVGISLRLSNPEPDTPLACIRDATLSNISKAAINESKQLLEQAKTNLSITDLQAAKQIINDMPDSSSEKKELENEVIKINNYIKIQEAITSLKSNNNEELYKKIEKSINEISDPEVKEKLKKEFEEAGKGRPLDVQPGTHQSSSSTLTYYVNVPEKVTTNLPLIMFLHGDGGEAWAQNSPVYTAAKKYFGNNFPFIIVNPAGGMWAETSGRLAELKNIIDTVCSKYSCDKSKISITGASRGSIGTWHLVNNYPGFFFAAVPVSCGAYSNLNPGNFKNTKVRAFAGTVGSNEQRYNSEMRAIVSKIQAAGGNATFTQLDGQNHGTTPSAAYTQETLLFMIQ